MTQGLSRRAIATGLIAATLAPTARAQPYPNDTLIVPGVRIGGVYLGMSVSDLHQLKGDPTGIETYPNNTLMFWDGDLGLNIRANHVVAVHTSRNRYGLTTGLTVDASELALLAQRPNFHLREELTEGYFRWEYADGLKVQSVRGVIRELGVFLPRDLRRRSGGDYDCWRTPGECRRVRR